MESLLTHSFDSIKVSVNGTEVRVTKPYLDITILGNQRGVLLKLDTVDAAIQIPEADTLAPKKDSAVTPRFPEDLEIPVVVRTEIHQANVQLSDGKHWSVSGLSVRNHSEKSVGLWADSIKGDYISNTASLSFFADFEKKNLTVNATVKTEKDSVSIRAEAPKNNLTVLKTKVALNVDKPTDWIPFPMPSAVPGLGKLKVDLNATLNAETKKTRYNATVMTRVGAFWPLMEQNITVNLKGDQDTVNVDITTHNDEGGKMHFAGTLDKNLDGTLEAQVENMNAMFGPQMMPLDLEIPFLEKKGDLITTTIETRQGSLIDCSIDLKDSLYLVFNANISKYEPWAVDWTHGNLILGKNPKLYGIFDMHKLKILAKFDTVEYAYHIKADSMQVTLSLDTKGIDFSNGIIYAPKDIYDFDGDVKWGTEDPHTSWNLTQRNGGKASAYINIGDTISIDVNAEEAVIATIPFADIKIGDRINGRVSGEWHQDFDNNIGNADISLEGELDAFHVTADIIARQNGDTIFIDKANATQNSNIVRSYGVFILPNDSNPDFTPTGFLPIQVVTAWISSREFSIPLLLEPLNDTTLASGMLNGDLTYRQEDGLDGNLDFYDIEFSNIAPEVFNIRNLNIFAIGDKVELNSYLDIGGGGWTGNTQVILDHVFNSDNRHVSFAHSTDNGGTLWAEGFLSNDFIFKGTVDANGSWYIPKTISEITNTDLHIDITADITKGLTGITADIKSDSTTYQPPKMDVLIPLNLKGHLENGLLDITQATMTNSRGDSITATLQFSLDSMKLDAIDVSSDSYTLQMDEHLITLEGIKGHLEDGNEDLVISAEIPKISYNFKHDMYGEAEAFGYGDIQFNIPHTMQGQIKNNSISGNITIDKLVYHKDFDIEVTPASLDKYLTMFNNSIAKLRKKESQETKLSTASPINLSLHISESQKDSVAIVTPFATFPFTFDIQVLGSTNRPLLRGDIANTNNGFIGVKDIYEFELNSFQISWNDVPWQHGVIDVTSSQELHYCNETPETSNETCPINLDIQGTITNPQPIPSSNCGTESSSAATYYNIFLGCIADDNGETTDWNKLAGKAIGKVISATANKTLGGEYIGDIDMKVMLFENTTTSDKDSSYVKVPVSLDRWVKNLSLVFGYTQDQSEDPIYDQALQFGINYTLPVFQEDEYSHKNHISPTLSLNALLISKQYLTNTGTESNENRVEKNLGINYIYRYWNPCLLGFGHCESIEESTNQKETKK